MRNSESKLISDLNFEGPDVVALVVKGCEPGVLGVADLPDGQDPEVATSDPRNLKNRIAKVLGLLNCR